MRAQLFGRSDSQQSSGSVTSDPHSFWEKTLGPEGGAATPGISAGAHGHHHHGHHHHHGANDDGSLELYFEAGFCLGGVCPLRSARSCSTLKRKSRSTELHKTWWCVRSHVDGGKRGAFETGVE